MAPATTANAKRAGSTSQVWGYVIVLGAALAFVLSMYMMFFSKLLLYLDDVAISSNTARALATTTITGSSSSTDATTAALSPPPSSGILRAIEQDVYYCYLLPLTIPVSFVAFYANWVSLKFFRHN